MLPAKPFYVAEIGINANGSVILAKKLIDMAKSCGCHAVKFQKRDIDIVYSQEILDSPRESPWGKTQRDQKQGLEFGEREYDEIDSYCKETGIDWFASAWDLNSLKFLQKYNLKYNKIASVMLTHQDLVEEIAKDGNFTFISTGMSTLKEIDRVVELFDVHNTPFCLLHCVSVYPCPDEWCNLLMIPVLQQRYGRLVGYSGHEEGILPSVLAVSLGSEVIERHVTLDRGYYGSDQSASLEKKGLELLIRDCNDVYKMLGSGVKQIIPEEEKVMHKLRYWHET